MQLIRDAWKNYLRAITVIDLGMGMQQVLLFAPGTPSADGDWCARHNSNVRFLPWELPTYAKSSKIWPVAATEH